MKCYYQKVYFAEENIFECFFLFVVIAIRNLMDDKLEKYRKQKKRQEFFGRMKEKFLAMIVPERKENKNTDEVIRIPEVSNHVYF